MRVVGLAVVVVLVMAPAGALAQTDVDYQTAVGGLSARMAALVTQAADVNAAWDAREVSFADTQDAFQSIEREMGLVVDEVRLLTAPDELAAQQAAMVEAAEKALVASAAMIDGLNDPNDSQARVLATDQFTLAGNEFVDIAGLVSTPPATTTTLPPTTTSTTTTVVAATSTTSPPVTAALPSGTESAAPESGSGRDASPLLVLIGLLAGLLVGVTGGLLIGRRARRTLIDALQRERSGGNPPPVT